MRQTIETMRKENGEMKLPQEISQQLYELLVMEEKEMRLKDSDLHCSLRYLNNIYLLESMINFSARQYLVSEQ